MKGLRLLALPWLTWQLTTRRPMASGFLVVISIAVLAWFVSGYPEPARALRWAYALAMFNAVFWALVIARNLVLANVAHRLRLPALGQQAATSTAIYVLPTVLLPASALAITGCPLPIAVTELALGAGIGMTYATLPLRFGIGFCLVPMLIPLANTWLPMPATDPTGFVAWAIPAALALWLSIGLAWQYGARVDRHAVRPSRRSIVLGWLDRSPAANASRTELALLQRPGARRPFPIDWVGVGAAHPTATVRIALGGWSMPLTWAGRLRQIGLATLATLGMLAALTLLLGPSDDAGLRVVLTRVQTIVYLCVLFAAVLGPVRADLLRARWERPNRELPMLALLPGLGSGTQVQRTVIRAGLLPVLGVQATLLAVTLLAAARLHLPAGDCSLLLLAQGTGMFATFSLGVASLAGTVPAQACQSAATIAGLLLVMITTGLALPPFNTFPVAQHPLALGALLAAWSALLAALLGVGWHGWTTHRAQPHPFLQHACL